MEKETFLIAQKRGVVDGSCGVIAVILLACVN